MRRNQRKLAIFAYAAGIVLAGAALYLSFELGRYKAGYSKLDARRETAALEQQVASMAAELEELRRQQAILETSQDIDRETYATVEVDLKELEETIQAQEEELAFYRGIVSPGDGVTGLRIQDLEILSGDAEQRHLMRLILVQAIVHNQRVSGTVTVRLDGMLGGEAAGFELGQLVGDGGEAEIAYRFRYFQSLEQALVLPVGFEPETVEVEIRPREPRGDPILQRFEWAAVAG